MVRVSRLVRHRRRCAPCVASMSHMRAARGWIGSPCPTSAPTFCFRSSSGSHAERHRRGKDARQAKITGVQTYS